MDEQVGSAVEDASGRIRQVVQRVQALCQMERQGIWEKMHQHSADEPDMEHLIIDSTTVRAHPCAAGAPHKKGDNGRRLLGEVEGVSARKCM